MLKEILTVNVKEEEKFLRKKVSDFDFTKFTKKEIATLLANMKRIMRAANGIGLSANQIGLDFNLFIAEVPDPKGGMKFYAVFNATLEPINEELVLFEEGCLSVPGKWGDVPRAEKVILRGNDRNAKPIKIKAWGLLARVFQHETDHLNGKLFIDRAKKIYETEKEA